MGPFFRRVPRASGGLCLLLGLALTACGQAPRRWELERPAMGTRFRFVIYGSDEDASTDALGAAWRRARELDSRLSDYDSESELRRLCARALVGREEEVSPDLAAVLRTAQGLARRTGGAFDVSVGPLTALWRASRRAGRLPAPEVLRRARGSTGWERVQVRPRRDLVRFAASGVLLDLGGIAKGYAAQEALAVLRAHGFERAMVDAGGDLALGAPPPGRAGWRIGLSPFGREGAPAEAYLDLRGVGVATSGDRYRALVVDGVRYSHLLDPRTGLGVTHRIEVTVIAADAMAADALASAVSVLGWDAGYALLRRTPGAEGILRRRGEGGEVEERRTPGFTALLAPR